MSRWAETFAALSGSHDTCDTSDTRSEQPSAANACVANVNSVSTQAERPVASQNTLKQLRKGASDRPCVACVASVKDRALKASPAVPCAKPPPADTSATLATQADKAERVGIVDHDAGTPRAWVEGFARLDPDRPPGDVPLRRWECFVDDLGRFLDGGFAEQAAALGWGPIDLFGCDRDRPFARIDKAGLLWLLNGSRLVALSADTALIEMREGVRHTYRRRPAESGPVLPWELPTGPASPG